MPYDPLFHHRRSIRLPGYDYTRAGAYFVTLCTWNRECLFGEVAGGEMVLSRFGQIAAQKWQEIPRHFPNTALDEWVVMPNHLHGIVWILEDDAPTSNRRDPGPPADHPAPVMRDAESLDTAGNDDWPHGPPPGSLGAIVGNFKSVTTRRINRMRHIRGGRVWQRGYWERIVRDERALENIRRYIHNNPARWAEDEERTSCQGGG